MDLDEAGATVELKRRLIKRQPAAYRGIISSPILEHLIPTMAW